MLLIVRSLPTFSILDVTSKAGLSQSLDAAKERKPSRLRHTSEIVAQRARLLSRAPKYATRRSRWPRGSVAPGGRRRRLGRLAYRERLWNSVEMSHLVRGTERCQNP